MRLWLFMFEKNIKDACCVQPVKRSEYRLKIFNLFLSVFICLLLIMPSAQADEHDDDESIVIEEIIRIGVLSHRGDEVTQQMWSSTADYLSKSLSQYNFEIIPLDFDEIEPAVSDEAIDFLLVNSGIYVNMEVRHRVSRIVTMNPEFIPSENLGIVVRSQVDSHGPQFASMSCPPDFPLAPRYRADEGNLLHVRIVKAGAVARIAVRHMCSISGLPVHQGQFTRGLRVLPIAAL